MTGWEHQIRVPITIPKFGGVGHGELRGKQGEMVTGRPEDDKPLLEFHVPVAGTYQVKTPDQFANGIRQQVETNDVGLVFSEGVDGFRHSPLGSELGIEFDRTRLSCSLPNRGVLTGLVDSVDQVIADFNSTPSHVSSFTESQSFPSYPHIEGKIRTVIGVLKRGTSHVERSVRDVEITRNGIVDQTPPSGLRGILSGTPEILIPHTKQLSPS